MAADLVLAHLYPDLLQTYADRGNVLTLARRAQWRGFTVDVVDVSRGDPLPHATSLILLGGGTDRLQEIVATDLLARRAELEAAIANGAVLFGVCGGYQLLGADYTFADGRVIEGLGLLDLHTVAEASRIVGRVVADATLWGQQFEVVGFENHAGLTHLGPDAAPFAILKKGLGNNGEDGAEGAVRDRIVGTYLHGPVLPANPRFADALLGSALARATGGAPLAPLDDTLELAAHREARRIRR